MGSESVRALGAEGRDDIFWFDPEKLYIEEKEGAPGYDPRVKLALKPEHVANVVREGIIEPVIARRVDLPDGSVRMQVMDGRQRVRWGREANRLLRAQGKQPWRIPVRRMRADESRMFSIMVSTNEVRQNDDPIGRAHKVQQALEIGFTIEETAVIFGVSVSAVRQYLSVIEAAPAVQEAVQAKTLPLAEAITLAKNLDPVAQTRAVKEITAGGPIKGKAAKRAVAKAAKVKEHTEMRGKREATKLLKACEANGWKEGAAVARYLMGEEVKAINELLEDDE